MVFLFFLSVCLGVGALGSHVTAISVSSWYTLIEKPSWTPSNWLFPPVWTTIFVLMAIAAWMVWKAAGCRFPARVFAVFVLQLVLNLGWSILFFGMQSPGSAFIEIIFLWAIIIFMIAMFRSKSPVTTFLLLPYLVWITFAGYLNYAIWILNP